MTPPIPVPAGVWPAAVMMAPVLLLVIWFVLLGIVGLLLPWKSPRTYVRQQQKELQALCGQLLTHTARSAPDRSALHRP